MRTALLNGNEMPTCDARRHISRQNYNHTRSYEQQEKRWRAKGKTRKKSIIINSTNGAAHSGIGDAMQYIKTSILIWCFVVVRKQNSHASNLNNLHIGNSCTPAIFMYSSFGARSALCHHYVRFVCAKMKIYKPIAYDCALCRNSRLSCHLTNVWLLPIAT